jgi:hypothetical protein
VTPREIQSAMKRLFYGDLPDADPWRHIFDDQGNLDDQKCYAVLATYIPTPDVLLYGGNRSCAIHCALKEAPRHIDRMLQEGKGVRAATPDFTGRALFNPIGVATGRQRNGSQSREAQNTQSNA